MSTRSAFNNPIVCLVLATTGWHCAATHGQLASAPAPETPVQPVSATGPADRSVIQAQEGSAALQTFVLPAKHHAWARFPAGSWREIQTTTETFDETGAVVSRSVTTQQESLQSASDLRYALNVQATVDLVGKRITGKWINRVLQTATDGAGPVISSRRLKDRKVTVSQQLLDCQVWEVTYSDETRVLVDRLSYSPEHFPYILRRKTTVDTGGQDSTAPVEQVQSVVALEMPYLVDDRVVRCTCLETTRQGEKGSSVRVSLVSEEIPGGEVAVWSTDFDPKGRRSRWSSQQLVNYGHEAPAESQQLRRETRRARRLSR